VGARKERRSRPKEEKMEERKGAENEGMRKAPVRVYTGLMPLISLFTHEKILSFRLTRLI